jgi:Uma2 family endonuclease
MSTTLQHSEHAPPPSERPPELQNGDRLTRAEFERRYAAMEHVKKAELIEGEVFMGSRVSFLSHAQPHANVMAWLGLYMMNTTAALCGDNGSVVLDLDNEIQPDAILLIESAAGGQAHIGEDGYIHGAPELVVEIAASSVSIDLNRKLNAYRRNGVHEYVVWRMLDREIDWFVLRDGMFEKQNPDSAGLLRSQVFPGLVLDPAAMIAGNLKAVAASQTSALNSPEHGAFVQRLSLALPSNSA